MLERAYSQRRAPDLGSAAEAIMNARKAMDSVRRFLPHVADRDTNLESLSELIHRAEDLESAIRRYESGA
jgi:hypothetical protein